MRDGVRISAPPPLIAGRNATGDEDLYFGAHPSSPTRPKRDGGRGLSDADQSIPLRPGKADRVEYFGEPHEPYGGLFRIHSLPLCLGARRTCGRLLGRRISIRPGRVTGANSVSLAPGLLDEAPFYRIRPDSYSVGFPHSAHLSFVKFLIEFLLQLIECCQPVDAVPAPP